MLKENNDIEVGAKNNNWARTCDTCGSGPCTTYCRADSAYLCKSCDARIHAANRVASRHERFWVCEACERVPAAFLCKADSASLCVTCDSEIHSANPLASRHQRVPVMPIPSTSYGLSATDLNSLILTGDAEDEFLTQDCDSTIDEEDENEAASWLLLNPVKNSGDRNNDNVGLFGREVDEYLDLNEYNSCQDNQFSHEYSNQRQNYSADQKSYGRDSVVPVQYGKSMDHVQNHGFEMAMECDQSCNNGYNYPSSVTHSVSIACMDVGVVPDIATEAPISQPRPPKGTIDLFSSPPIQMPTQLTPMDREARVLRYREKKKTRKFEKTIRYASRKAYAETRTRIKGRFAKRTDIEVEVDKMFSTSMVAESGYGLVPSF